MHGRVLIIEDDDVLARVIADNLRFAGYEVSSTGDGNEALTLQRTLHPDLVLLDLNLPNRNGFDLCGILRRGGQTPVVILSARAQKTDKLRGLKLGADDYLTKPFDLEELLARIHAVLRRTRRGAVDRLVLGELTIDFRSLTATMGQREIHLTHREFDVLRYLAERQDRVVHRDELLREIWGYLDAPTTRSVDHAIARLRKKIEPDPHRPRYVRTAHGDGYTLGMTVEPAAE